MQPELAYELFTGYLTRDEPLTVKRGKGGLSYYKYDVFVCHFNAQPRRNRNDLGFADFRYDGLRRYLDVENSLAAIQKDARSEVQIKSHKLWCSLHFPLSELEHVATLFLSYIISKINP